LIINIFLRSGLNPSDSYRRRSNPVTVRHCSNWTVEPARTYRPARAANRTIEP